MHWNSCTDVTLEMDSQTFLHTWVLKHRLWGIRVTERQTEHLTSRVYDTIGYNVIGTLNRVLPYTKLTKMSSNT